MCSNNKVDAIIFDCFIDGSNDLGLSAEATRITSGVGSGECHDINKDGDTIDYSSVKPNIKENVSYFVMEDIRKISREWIAFGLGKEISVISRIACETVEGRFIELHRNVLDLVVLAFSLLVMVAL
jgi:hypothetical protein